MSNYTDRYARAVQADTPGWIAEVVRRYGLSPGHMRLVLDMASKLSQPSGATLTREDAATICQMVPHEDPKAIAAACQEVNALPPAQRSAAFIGGWVSDLAAVQGDYVRAGDNWRHVTDMVREHTTMEIASELDARRGGSESERADPSTHPEPGSVRALITEQMKGGPRREMEQALASDDPAALDFARNEVANSIEHASNYLARGGGDSIRDSLEAAVDLHVGEQIARDTFGVE